MIHSVLYHYIHSVTWYDPFPIHSTLFWFHSIHSTFDYIDRDLHSFWYSFILMTFGGIHYSGIRDDPTDVVDTITTFDTTTFDSPFWWLFWSTVHPHSDYRLRLIPHSFYHFDTDDTCWPLLMHSVIHFVLPTGTDACIPFLFYHLFVHSTRYYVTYDLIHGPCSLPIPITDTHSPIIVLFCSIPQCSYLGTVTIPTYTDSVPTFLPILHS